MKRFELFPRVEPNTGHNTPAPLRMQSQEYYDKPTQTPESVAGAQVDVTAPKKGDRPLPRGRNKGRQSMDKGLSHDISKPTHNISRTKRIGATALEHADSLEVLPFLRPKAIYHSLGNLALVA